MPKKTIIRKSISDAQLKDELIKLFESGNTDKGKCLEELGSKYKIQIQRFYKTFNIVILEWQKTREKAQNELIQANATESLKTALKSKLERTLFYQNEIKLIEAQLRGEVKFTFVVGNKVMNSHKDDVFVVPVQVQNELRATIKSLQTEISKIEGDYAPIRNANTDSKGNDVPTQIIIGVTGNNTSALFENEEDVLK